MRGEVLVDVETALGERPVWDVDERRLRWIDSFDGRVFRAAADGPTVDAEGCVRNALVCDDGLVRRAPDGGPTSTSSR